MARSHEPVADGGERQDAEGKPARGVLERGLGKDFNIVVVAALLSLAVSFATSVITSRMESRNELRDEQRRVERDAIVNLQKALLRETEAAVAVAAEGLPARLPPVVGVRASGAELVSPVVVEYLSAYREFEAAWGAVVDGRIRAATKEVSDLTVRVVYAKSTEEAQQYDADLTRSRQEAVTLMNDRLKNI